MYNKNLSVCACGGFESSREDQGACFDVAMLPYPSTPRKGLSLIHSQTHSLTTFHPWGEAKERCVSNRHLDKLCVDFLSNLSWWDGCFEYKSSKHVGYMLIAKKSHLALTFVVLWVLFVATIKASNAINLAPEKDKKKGRLCYRSLLLQGNIHPPVLCVYSSRVLWKLVLQWSNYL